MAPTLENPQSWQDRYRPREILMRLFWCQRGQYLQAVMKHTFCGLLVVNCIFHPDKSSGLAVNRCVHIFRVSWISLNI